MKIHNLLLKDDQGFESLSLARGGVRLKRTEEDKSR